MAKTVALEWTTESEVNTKYFVIEKSFDQVSFAPITNVAASGNAKPIDITSIQITLLYKK